MEKVLAEPSMRFNVVDLMPEPLCAHGSECHVHGSHNDRQKSTMP